MYSPASACGSCIWAQLAVHVQFCEQLRQPLCLALLRNCTSVFDEAYSAATRLFTAILLRPKLRWAADCSSQGGWQCSTGLWQHLSRLA